MMKPASCKQLPGASCQALASLVPSLPHSSSLTQVQALPAVPPLLTGTSYDQESWFLLLFIAISFIEHLLCARHWAGHLALGPSQVDRPLRLPQVTAVPRPHRKADPVPASIHPPLPAAETCPLALLATSRGMALQTMMEIYLSEVGGNSWGPNSGSGGAASAPIQPRCS